MRPAAALITRDHRIVGGHAAGATIPGLAIAEEIDPAVVRRVLRAAGITGGPIHPPPADRAADAARLASEYAMKRAPLGRAEGRIARDLDV